MSVKAFEFATAVRIIFGRGTASQLDAVVAGLGARPFFVTGARNASDQSFVVSGEPTVDLVRLGSALCGDRGCEVVIGKGGGSVIDAAKAIAALAANPGDPLDYLEVIGRGQPLTQPALPFVAIPTTAGTGSEVTRNAVLGSHEHGVKASLRSVSMLPRVAIVDPELTLDLPPNLTASTGLDALTQLIEPYVSVKANELTDSLCLEGLRRVARSLRTAYGDGANLDAREDMSFAALLGGMALANAGLGVVHGFAAPIGGRFPAPHGAVCAALLPQGMEANLRALRATDTGSVGVQRYTTIARTLTGIETATADDGVDHVRELCSDLNIPRLRAYGITEADTDGLVAQAAKASSMKANAVVLSPNELAGVLQGAL